MARLPTPGGDDNTWGDILNDFLSVSHNSDGTLKGVVKDTGAQTVAGVKTFSSSPIVPTPTSGTDTANKAYVDASGGTPDADATTKGKVQLAGDLSGTAASPQIAAGVIVDADVNATAAIAQSKIANLTTDLGNKQASDTDLTAIAGLTPSNDDIIQRKTGAWTNRTPAQLKTDLSLTKSDVGLGSVDNTSDAGKPVSTATQTALDLKLDDSQLDTDGTLTANSDTVIATQKATKTYADTKTAKSTLTTKGDIYVATAASTPARLGAGNLAEGLITDSSTSTGLRWFPTQVHVSKITMGGHSYTDQTAGMSETETWGTQYNVDQSMPKRILTMLGVSESQFRNLGVSGAKLIQGTTAGGWVTTLRGINPTRARAPYTSINGLCIAVWGINDLNAYGSSSQYRTAYQHALRTVISRYRASAVFENDDTTTVTLSGGWSTTASTTINSGANYSTTSTLNDTITITVPSSFEGGTIAIGLIGASGVTGGTVTFNSINAPGGPLSLGSISTSNITADGHRTGMVKRLTGLPAAGGATYTIIGTVSALDGGGSVQFDYWQIETPYPNPVIICNIAKLNSYSGSGIGASDSEVDVWNTAIASVVAEFPNPIAVADIAEVLKPTGRLAADTIHPSEVGAMYIAEAVRQAYVKTGGVQRDFSTPSSFNSLSSLPVYPTAQIAASTWVSQTGVVLSSTNLTLTQDKVYFVPVVLSQPCILSSMILWNITTLAAGSSVRMGIYWDYKSNPRNLLVDGGTVSSATTGSKTLTFATAVKIQVPGLYWLAVCAQGGAPVCQAVVGGSPFVYVPTAGGVVRPSAFTYTSFSGAFSDITGANGVANQSAVGLAPDVSVTVSSISS